MSCWRVLELSEQLDDQEVPQLLVKPVFRSDSYIVHLTCLSNIWSEELDLHGIVDRALKEQSPIEVSKRDTAQLAILLDNIKRSLESSEDAICRITRHGTDGITLHTTISLPKPLDSLTWKFYLVRRASTTLKNELILPLLISSHIQHARINSLISTINEKDKAITRLVDQYESSNLDLSAAFPSIGGLKSGRRLIKREQAARHVPALQPFRADAFKQETRQLVEPNVNTLGLFQEALSECTSDVPSQLKSDGLDLGWWTGISDRLSHWNHVKSKAKEFTPKTKPAKAILESSDIETEDEFELHENFKTRNLQSKTTETPKPPIPSTEAEAVVSEDDATEDEDDLDAPPKSRSHTSSQNMPKPSPTHPLPTQTRPDTPPAKSKSKGFRIGGAAKQAPAEPPLPANDALATKLVNVPTNEPPSSPTNTDLDATPQKPKRTFKIGGKGKGAASSNSQGPAKEPTIVNRTRAAHSPRALSSSPPSIGRVTRDKSPVVEKEHEETPEEKAERRRAELKRKTEEAAKKQAQSKKKKRF